MELPDEILVQVFSELGVLEKLKLGAQCRRLRRVMLDERLWQHRIRVKVECGPIGKTLDRPSKLSQFKDQKPSPSVSY